MDRRQFLAAGATIVGVGLAGCPSDSNGNELETAQQRLTEVQNELNETRGKLSDAKTELNATKDELQSAKQTITASHNQIDSLESTLNAKNRTIADLESSLTAQETATETQKKKLVLWFYGYGLTVQNAAVESYNSGYEYLSNGEYFLAAQSFSASSGQYDASKSLFNAAYERATDHGFSTVRSYCSDAERAMELMETATEQYAIAARELANGNEGDPYLSDGDEYYSQREEISLVRRSVLEADLGVEITSG